MPGVRLVATGCSQSSIGYGETVWIYWCNSRQLCGMVRRRESRDYDRCHAEFCRHRRGHLLRPQGREQLRHIVLRRRNKKRRARLSAPFLFAVMDQTDCWTTIGWFSLIAMRPPLGTQPSYLPVAPATIAPAAAPPAAPITVDFVLCPKI